MSSSVERETLLNNVSNIYRHHSAFTIRFAIIVVILLCVIFMFSTQFIQPPTINWREGDKIGANVRVIFDKPPTTLIDDTEVDKAIASIVVTTQQPPTTITTTIVKTSTTSTTTTTK